MILAIVKPNPKCDCGQAGVKRDGSGWFCLECERVVKAAQAMLDEQIRKQRHDHNSPDSKTRHDAYMRDYAVRNREKLKAHQKTYNREWKRKNLLRGMA
jgi:hypothetical protein